METRILRLLFALVVFLCMACEQDTATQSGALPEAGEDSDFVKEKTDVDTDPIQDTSSSPSTPSTGDTDGYACVPGEPIILPAIVRDFSIDGPNTDFQSLVTSVGLELSVVKVTLGNDRKPVFNVQPNVYYSSFGGAENFSQWYNSDPEGVFNMEFSKSISLEEQSDGSWVFDTSYFFPLNVDEGYGDEGDMTGWYDDESKRDQPQNYRFTTEFHMRFNYEAGQVFNFRGDDDVWVFINDELVIDLGGIHGPEEAEIDLGLLNLDEGESYAMDIFHAERNPNGSNFRIQTNIKCLKSVIAE